MGEQHTPRCTCGRIKIGHSTTDLRNWNPDCEEHGVGTDWYDSDDQVARREAMSLRLRDLQRQARDARRAAADG